MDDEAVAPPDHARPMGPRSGSLGALGVAGRDAGQVMRSHFGRLIGAPHQPGAGRAWTGRARSAVVPLTLVGLSLVAFAPGLGNGFVNWDDEHNFLKNEHFRGLGWDPVAWAWTTLHLGAYQPLGWMLLSAQYRAWGLDPGGYHAVSLAWHAATVVALYALTLHLLDRCRSGSPRARGQGLWAGLAVAGYAVHPLRVEAVSWASCQPYLPCAFFAVLSVLAYLRANPEGLPPRTGWLIGSLLLYGLSLGFKAPSVGLPGVLLLLDVYPLRRLGGAGRWRGPSAEPVWREKLWFLSLALVFAGLAYFAKASMPSELAPTRPGLLSRVAAACYAAWFYLGKTVAPHGVAAYYVTPTPVLWSEPPFLASAVGAAGLGALLVVMRKRRPALLATWAAFLVILIPVAGFAPQGQQLVSDRYTYLAAMALVPLMAAGLIRLASSDRGPRRAVVVAVTAMGVAAALTGQTRAVCRTWHDSESLWVHALAHGARRSLAVHNNLAAEYYRQGRIDRAIATWQAALTIPPDPSDVSGRVLILSNLGRCLERGDRPDEAIARFAETAQLAPQSAAAHYQWGRALAAAGRYDAAIPRFARALALDPHHEAARSALDECRRGRGASFGGPDLGPPIP